MFQSTLKNYFNQLFILASLASVASCGSDLAKILDEVKEEATYPETTDATIVDARHLYVAKDNATSVTVGWLKSDQSGSSGYRVVYAEGATASPDCLGEQDSVSADDVADESAQVTGLTPLTTYSFRVCTLNEDGKSASVGSIITARTLPTCDYTVATNELDDGSVDGLTFSSTDDGIDSTAEMTAFLAAASVAADPNLDTYKTVCLADGLSIQNSNALNGAVVTIPANNFVIYAALGDSAEIVNAYTTDGTKTQGYAASGRTGLELHNVTITTNGSGGDGVALLASSEMTAASRLTVTLNGIGGSAIWADANSVLESLVDFDVTVAHEQAVGLVASSGGVLEVITKGTIEAHNLNNSNGYTMGIAAQVSPARLGQISNVAINTSGKWNHGIFLTHSSAIDSLNDVTIRTAGEDAMGIYTQVSAHIDGLNRVTVKRAAAAVTSAAGIVINRSGGAGYFVTEAISDVTVCTEVGGQTWETGNGKTIAWANGFPAGAAFTFPTSHAAYTGANPGIENFPFDVGGGTAGTDAGISLGGACAG